MLIIYPTAKPPIKGFKYCLAVVESISGLHFALRLRLDTIIAIQSLSTEHVEIYFIRTYRLVWHLSIQTQYGSI